MHIVHMYDLYVGHLAYCLKKQQQNLQQQQQQQ